MASVTHLAVTGRQINAADWAAEHVVDITAEDITDALGYEPANVVHEHDDRYYTETEVNQLLSTITGQQPVPEGLVSGGQVIWESGLTFRVSAAVYYINGVQYSAAEQTVTLAAADATHPRIDVLALDDTGDFVAVQGTAAASPSQPDIDPGTQLGLTFVLVPAGATALTVTITNIYLENTEWTTTVSGAGFNANGLVNPKSGTKCIDGTAVTANSYILFDKGPVDHDMSGERMLRLFIRSKSAWNSGRSLRLQWYANGVAKGVPVTLASGFWGFDSANVSTYQLVAIPITQFVIPGGALIDQLRITDAGGAINFYIDEITLESNSEINSDPGYAVADHTHTQVVSLLVSDPNGSALTTGDGKMYWRVPSTLNNWNLTAVAAAVTTVSTSGLPTVQVHNLTQAADMLTTKVSIDANELDSMIATTPAVIDTANDDVATGNMLRVDVDIAGTGTKGLMVELQFSKPA